MSEYIRQNSISINYKTGESWVILSEIEQSIKNKIEAAGIPLKDWNIKINRGVLTGLNEAFIISKEKKDELIKADPKSAEIIRPILRGRDIKKNSVDFQNLYLINAHNGYRTEDDTIIPPVDIREFPAIKNWLDNGNWNTKPDKGTNYERLANRTDKGITPYNLRSLAYMDDFNTHKIIYPNMTKYLPFYFDRKGFLTNQKTFIITGDYLEYLTAFFNSTLFKLAYRESFPELQGGTRELSKVYFEKLMVKYPSEEVNNSIKKLIIKLSNSKLSTQEKNIVEQAITEILCKFYDLNTEEIKYINGKV